MHGSSPHSKLSFEKRVVYPLSKMHRDVTTSYKRSEIALTSLCSHRFSNSCVSSSSMEMLTPDIPLCSETVTPTGSKKCRVGRVCSSVSLLGPCDRCPDGDGALAERAGDNSSKRTSLGKFEDTFSDAPAEPPHLSPLLPSVREGEIASFLDEMPNGCVHGRIMPKKRDIIHEKVSYTDDDDDDDNDDGSKDCSQLHTSSGGVSSISVPRSQESSAKGLMRVNLAHKALIGKGSFGFVFQAMDVDTNHIIAVKEIAINPKSDVDNTARKRTIDAIRSEILLMKQLDHPHIVKYIGEESDKDYLRLFLEYVSGGSISSVLRTFGVFQEKQAAIYTRQMLEGLSYLHSKNIVHRDLKGDNLLVDTQGILKISDFGTANELLDHNAATSLAGTAYFMAPEVIMGQKAGLASDIWSVGCCVIEMLTGSPPFSEVKNQYALMMRVAEHEGELFIGMLPKEQTFSVEAMSFLEKCLTRDPTKRPRARELLDEPWISGLSPPSCSENSPHTVKS